MKKIALLLTTTLALPACSYLDMFDPVRKTLKNPINVNVNVNANIDTTCMDNIDDKQLEAMEQRGKEMKNEVEALCKSGKRDAAQQKALQYAKEINNSEVMKQLRECSKKTGINQIIMPGIQDYSDDKTEHRHVCDDM